MRVLPDDFDASTLRAVAADLLEGAASALGAGPVHQYRVSEIDTRIVVSGTRGKSTAAEWLHDIFHRRGYDTYAKTTGTQPVSLYNGEAHDIERREQVRLYENERELARFDDIDVAVVENQGIRQYTTRLVNESYFNPQIVFLTNVREDHLDTLGHDRIQISRSLARAVPPGTVVVNGESDPTLRSYLTAELDRRDVIVRHVDVPTESEWIPGAEIVYGINEVLRLTGADPLLPEGLRRRLLSLVPEWHVLPEGRVHNAADVNDVQSTEIVRNALVGTKGQAVEPLLFLRGDRRGRTASFFRYLRRLIADGLAPRAHVIGTGARAFADNADFPVERHDTDDGPATVLDRVLNASRPVVVMGNTVDEFMRELSAEISKRALWTEMARVNAEGALPEEPESRTEQI